MCILKHQRGWSDVLLTHTLTAAEINSMLYPFVDLFGCRSAHWGCRKLCVRAMGEGGQDLKDHQRSRPIIQKLEIIVNVFLSSTDRKQYTDIKSMMLLNRTSLFQGRWFCRVLKWSASNSSRSSSLWQIRKVSILCFRKNSLRSYPRPSSVW